MKLAVGMRVIRTTAERQRYQIVELSAESVKVRRVVIGGGLLPHSYEWGVPFDEVNKPPDYWLRRIFESCFELDPTDPRTR